MKMLLPYRIISAAAVIIALLSPLAIGDGQTALCHIETDVVIIGGGAAGTYAAISLMDKGVNVVLVEQQPDLGGHADTYTDLTTGQDVNVGVQIFHDNSVVRGFAARLGASMAPPPPDGATLSIDLTTGKAQLDPEADPGIPAALGTYINILNASYPFLNKGFFLPDPVPEDLFLPFGDFAKKHDIVPLVFLLNRFTQGWDIIRVPTLYVFMIINLDLVSDIAAGTFLTTNDTNVLYRSALAILGERVLLNAHVTSVLRSNLGVRVHVKQEDTTSKVIKAKTLLMTGSPVLDNLQGWDLVPEEKTLFSKFSGFGYFAGVVSNPGFPDNTGFHNVASNNSGFHTPKLPAVFVINNTPLPDKVRTVYYGTPQGIHIDKSNAARMALDDLDRLVASQGYGHAKTKLLDWVAHGPFNIQVSAEDIKNGFYARLYALQGQRSTFWSGSTWTAQDSATIWGYTKNVVLPLIRP